MKKPTKKFISTFVCAIITITTMAQNVYVKVNAGYNFPFLTQTKLNTDHNPIGINTTEAVKYSYGKGYSFTGSFGVKINRNLSAEIGIGYLLGSKVKTTDNTYGTIDGTWRNTTDKNKMLFFVPALVIEYRFKKIDPYARFGFILCKPKICTHDDWTITTTTSTTYTKQVNQEIETKMNWGLGANIAIGILYNLSGNLSMFSECNINLLTITPKSSKMTKSTINGVDHLNDLTTSEKETEYVNKLPPDDFTPALSSEPTLSIKPKMPFSSLGFNLGVKFSF